MYALKAHINYPFKETFYGKLKKANKKANQFFIFP